MKIVSSKIHGMMDYCLGAGMIATPFLMKHEFTLSSTCILVSAGVATLFNSFTTNYEFGFARNISMGNHLRIDVVIAMLVCLLPVLFAFDFYLVNLLFGTAQFTLASITHKNAFYKMFHGFTYRKFEKFPRSIATD